MVMRHDIVSDALITIHNAEKVGKKECTVAANKLVGNILKILQDRGYIDEFEYIDNKRGGIFKIVLKNKINTIKAIRPRFSVKKDEFEKWERRYLPSAQLGLIFISTSKGVITHIEAKEKGVGGKLLGYVY